MFITAAPLARPQDRADLERETATYQPLLRYTDPRVRDSSSAQVAMLGVLAGRDRRRDPHPTGRGARPRRALARTVDERGG